MTNVDKSIIKSFINNNSFQNACAKIKSFAISGNICLKEVVNYIFELYEEKGKFLNPEDINEIKITLNLTEAEILDLPAVKGNCNNILLVEIS